MSKIKYTILASWPGLKEDLESFLSDTDAWIISELKKAHQAQDWESVHNMNHSH
ncbi:hypothetical protein ACFLT4_03825 [Chloroflexota bacterium]